MSYKIRINKVRKIKYNRRTSVWHWIFSHSWNSKNKNIYEMEESSIDFMQLLCTKNITYKRKSRKH